MFLKYLQDSLRGPPSGFCLEPNQCICGEEALAADEGGVCNDECINGAIGNTRTFPLKK